MHRNLLCKTIAGVDCELLTVTDTYTQTDEDPAAELKENKRKAVVISSRVHPGETVGSWMMRGILFFLTDPDNQEASLLRKNFVFKIIQPAMEVPVKNTSTDYLSLQEAN